MTGSGHASGLFLRCATAECDDVMGEGVEAVGAPWLPHGPWGTGDVDVNHIANYWKSP
jgi:hypothetical protein